MYGYAKRKKYFGGVVEFWKSTVATARIDKTFWKGKKVLVTWHTGFKGSWLSSWLKNLGAHVVG